jgi:hypothetical protein
MVWQQRTLIILTTVSMGLLWFVPSALATGPIALDGSFGDWGGQANVDDPQGDAKNEPTDLQKFYFATNPDDETAYFMAERWVGGAQPIGLRLYMDTNNNGTFNETSDRMVDVRYKPNKNGSDVDVELFDGSETLLSSIARDIDWGESEGEGGIRVEWGVSFAQLGILPNQTIRIYLQTMGGNSPSDRGPDNGDIQWSPATALGTPLLILLILAGAGLLFYQRKKVT